MQVWDTILVLHPPFLCGCSIRLLLGCCSMISPPSWSCFSDQRSQIYVLPICRGEHRKFPVLQSSHLLHLYRLLSNSPDPGHAGQPSCSLSALCLLSRSRGVPISLLSWTMATLVLLMATGHLFAFPPRCYYDSDTFLCFHRCALQR